MDDLVWIGWGANLILGCLGGWRRGGWGGKEGGSASRLKVGGSCFFVASGGGSGRAARGGVVLAVLGIVGIVERANVSVMVEACFPMVIHFHLLGIWHLDDCIEPVEPRC